MVKRKHKFAHFQLSNISESFSSCNSLKKESKTDLEIILITLTRRRRLVLYVDPQAVIPWSS